MKHKLILSITGIAAGVLVAGGVAYAAIPDSGGTIHACHKTVVPAHGTPLSIIDSEAGGTCPAGSTELTWPAAQPTLATQRIVTENTEMAPGEAGSALAVCPAGWRLTGGGFSLSSSAEGPPAIINSSAVKPVLGQSWEVDALNDTSVQAEVAAVAECAQLQ